MAMVTILKFKRQVSKNMSIYMTSIFSVLMILFTQVWACSVTNTGQNKGQLAAGKWDEEAFTISTVSLAVSPIAVWHITKDGTANSPVDMSVPYDKAEGVLRVFERQPKKRRDRGIFIHSWTYAIPDTPEEKESMTETLRHRYNNPQWRKSESDLINDLRDEGEKRKIPLYVNLSSNLQGKWKKLTSASEHDVRQ